MADGRGLETGDQPAAERPTPQDASDRPPSVEDIDESDPSLFARRVAGDEPPPKHVETWSALLLAVTVILVAWSGFQSSKWGGAMSISFAQASTARVQASTAQGEVDSDRQIDLSIFSLWLQARAFGDAKQVAYVEDRFTEWFKPAFAEWVALGGIKDPANAPKSPFALDSYVVPGSEDVVALNAKADDRYATALANNQRGDNYTILGVLFATVLFFAAMATRFTNRKVEYGMLAFASLGFVIGGIFLLTFPKLV